VKKRNPGGNRGAGVDMRGIKLADKHYIQGHYDWPAPEAFLLRMAAEVGNGVTPGSFRQHLGRRFQIPHEQSVRIVRLLLRYGLAFQSAQGKLYPLHASFPVAEIHQPPGSAKRLGGPAHRTIAPTRTEEGQL